MNKLVKRYDTDTDFIICIFQNQKNGRFVVTTYDFVSQKHSDNKSYDTSEEAFSDAIQRVKAYQLDESKALKSLIKECIQEEMERQAVKTIIKEELRRMYNEGVFEKKDDDKKKGEAEDKGADTARGQLKQMLDQNPIIKKSQIAYKLLPGVDHDSARHIFNDKLNGDDPMTTKEANIAIDMIHNAGV